MEVLLVIAIGLFVGMLIGIITHRVPKGISILFPSFSFCPSCGGKIKTQHTIPILSWVLLSGKSACCSRPISSRYLIIEVLVLGLFLAGYYMYGLSLYMVASATALSFFLSIALMDIDEQMIPDSINLLTLALAITSGYFGQLHEGVFNDALVMAGGFAILRFVASHLLKKEALGEADIMIAGTMGALLGVKLAVIAVFLSQLLLLAGVFLMGRFKGGATFAMAPGLFGATLICYVYGDSILMLLGV